MRSRQLCKYFFQTMLSYSTLYVAKIVEHPRCCGRPVVLGVAVPSSTALARWCLCALPGWSHWQPCSLWSCPYLKPVIAFPQEFYGDDAKKSRDYGRIINSRHFQRVMGLMEGQRVAYGGTGDMATLYIGACTHPLEEHHLPGLLGSLKIGG